MRGIKQISIVHDVGEHSKEIKSSVDRIGFVIAQDKTAEEAVNDCKLAMDKIVIKVG